MQTFVSRFPLLISRGNAQLPMNSHSKLKAAAQSVIATADFSPDADFTPERRVEFHNDINVTAVSQSLCFGGAVLSQQVVFNVSAYFLGFDAARWERPDEVEICVLGHRRLAPLWAEPETLRGLWLWRGEARRFIPASHYAPSLGEGGLWREEMRAELSVEEFEALCMDADQCGFSVAFDREIFRFAPGQHYQLGQLALFIKRCPPAQ